MTTSEEYEQKGNAAEEQCAVEKENIKLVICLPEPTPRGDPCRSWRDGAGWRQGGQETRSYEDKKDKDQLEADHPNELSPASSDQVYSAGGE